MGPEPVVHVVDDDPTVRRALKHLIESVGFAVETYACALDFLGEVTAGTRGCALVDVRMPGMSGLELQRALADRQIALPIIFVTGHGDINSSVRAMKAGALDFFEKPLDDQQLLDAIQRALARDAAQWRARRERAEVLRRLELLTARERDVFALVTSGRKNKEIAAELVISEGTVKVHRSRVMEKMAARSLAELVVLAQAAGLSTTKV